MEKHRPGSPPSVVFIGSPTVDHLSRGTGARQAIGGAAFISALAARWAGSSVGLVARVPTELPYSVATVFGVGGLDRGGLKTFHGELPSFRISYDTNDRATYQQMKLGMESDLCGADIPEEWLGTDCQWIHIAGIGANPAQQVDMARSIRERAPGWQGTLSAGTCRAMVEADLQGTLALLSASDVFFLNREEFELLCPNGLPAEHAGMVLVTNGPEGVDVIGGPLAGHYPVRPMSPMDPTGAGDSFCGGFIGAMVAGKSQPIEKGIQVASHVLEGMGADTLIHWVSAQVEQHADHVPGQIEAMGPLIRQHGTTSAFTFDQAPHLAAGHPLALSMLFVSTLHQYGFWTADAESGWSGPMYAEIEGVRYKGSDFIWAAFARAAREDPELLSIERMASDRTLFSTICTADDGTCPVPELGSHQQLHQAHGLLMKRRWPGGYEEILRQANSSPTPVQSLLRALSGMPGYMGDPLAKKANLLAVILGARPEGFLQMRDPENIVPIVDYHMMRVCLRTGLVHIANPELAHRIDNRMWVDRTEELAIRQATGRALLYLAEQTECSIAAIDGLFFQIGRSACLETEPPRCSACPLDTKCTHSTSRFQPVFRTTAY